MHNGFDTLSYRLPERNVPPLVYCNYNEERANAHNQFLRSQSDFKNLEDFKLPTFSPVRKPIPESSYAGITVCGLPLEEVGCGILTIAQGLVGKLDIVDRESIEKLTSIIERKGYYLKGKGLYWHTFKYFAGHLSCHWYEIVMAIECGNPVTVLLKYPENSRNLFTNIVATKNMLAICKLMVL